MSTKLISSKIIFGILTVVIVAVSLQSYFQGLQIFRGVECTNYNNYVIFKRSFYHLIQGKDLYQPFPSEHWDLFKYSPTFALLIAPLAILPDYIGLVLWNMLNGLILFYTFFKFSFPSQKNKLIAMGFILIEAITSLQNSQSNCLIAGLIILAFILLEKEKNVVATLLIIISVFIKPFGIVAFSLFLFYPKKIKIVSYSLMWITLLTLLPLIVISPAQLINLYKSWGNLLAHDHDISSGLSVMGWLYTWFGINVSKNIILLIGILVFCLPLLRHKFYRAANFKQLFLASILIWVVIFNHRAESPTFILAISGVAIWFFTLNYTIENFVLLLLALLFTTLSPTDIFPKNLRDQFVVPYVLKAVPCILIWLKLQYDLMTKYFPLSATAIKSLD